MSLSVRSVPVSPFVMNAYLVFDDETLEAVLIDPGDEIEKIDALVSECGVRVRWIVATHGHLDHIGAAAEAKRLYQVPFLMHHADDFLRIDLPNQAALFGLSPPEVPEVDRYIDESDRIPLGEEEISILATPGHSPGSITLVLPDGRLIAGDVLFDGSIGRTDLPGGSFAELTKTITDRFLTRDDRVAIYPGHGPVTTIGRERSSNPFLKGAV